MRKTLPNLSVVKWIELHTSCDVDAERAKGQGLILCFTFFMKEYV
jgi:hypothetical protein